MSKGSKQQGFSLIEVMVVLLIIGIMAGLIAPSILGNQATAQIKKAAVDIQQLESSLELYKLKTNTFPTTEQGLEALVTVPTIDPIPRNYQEGGFIKRLPEDPWGNPYQLLSPGELGVIDIFSFGPDGLAGTEDDIGNWNLNDYL
ncbi:MAG: type II secretion system major pseudopilin GspG [Paraglaciecola sp.]|uniref:type II secretion system major pseudopilin GspG n=1 Tax=Pseudomonadati TaxID=3379134 RepID=UPI00273D8814|nr:type II secretion system major pseudopilin GspG [Paraglaciecola sp.]MDP5030413.1 type II secretion system major pseudopilin GspG [Paraglaciecola sp.]MDP5039573.1 type II secretion system major pseudopilin GspG [Paraglaciecola sp.]MDP5131460.1 type II secretion system major pseudopilin GspG [Paraglaciecola sp.]